MHVLDDVGSREDEDVVVALEVGADGRGIASPR